MALHRGRLIISGGFYDAGDSCSVRGWARVRVWHLCPKGCCLKAFWYSTALQRRRRQLQVLYWAGSGAYIVGFEVMVMVRWRCTMAASALGP